MPNLWHLTIGESKHNHAVFLSNLTTQPFAIVFGIYIIISHIKQKFLFESLVSSCDSSRDSFSVVACWIAGWCLKVLKKKKTGV